MFLVTINDEVCTGCGEVRESCPAQIITVVDSKAQVTAATSRSVWAGRSCVIVCSIHGIEMQEY